MNLLQKRAKAVHFIGGFALVLSACSPSSQPRDYKRHSTTPTQGVLSVDDLKSLMAKSGSNTETDKLYWLDFQDYMLRHGEVDSMGQPLAGGGVVGRDDWRTVNFLREPTEFQRSQKLMREHLARKEMSERDPIADARAAVAKGDWKLYFAPNLDGCIECDPWSLPKPLVFRVIGLDKFFGSKMSEETMKKYGKRRFESYYDIRYCFPLPKWHYGKIIFVSIECNLSRDAFTSLDLMENYYKKYNEEVYNIASKNKH